MKLKLDEEQRVVLQDEKPVYVYEDGKEIAFDAPAAMSKIKDLNSEAKNHRLKADDYRKQSEQLQVEIDKIQKSMSNYEGLDAKKAKKAIETLKQMQDGTLLEADKVEAIKNQLATSFDEEKNTLLEQFGSKETEFQQTIDQYTQDISAKDKKIYELLVTNQFASLPFIQANTTMTPDVAAKMFGDHFKIENNDGELSLVAYLNGEKIMSREQPGDTATFDEAFKIIWDSYPNRDAYTKTTSGSGASTSVSSDTRSGEDVLKSFYGTM